MTARVAIALVLLVLLGLLHAGARAQHQRLADRPVRDLPGRGAGRADLHPPPPPGQTFDPQWVSTIGVDLLAFSTLQFLQAGGINYSPLFALPVLMGSVLGSALLALGTAAGVTLLLLTDAWVLRWLQPATRRRASCRPG